MRANNTKKRNMIFSPSKDTRCWWPFAPGFTTTTTTTTTNDCERHRCCPMDDCRGSCCSYCGWRLLTRAPCPRWIATAITVTINCSPENAKRTVSFSSANAVAEHVVTIEWDWLGRRGRSTVRFRPKWLGLVRRREHDDGGISLRTHTDKGNR